MCLARDRADDCVPFFDGDVRAEPLRCDGAFTGTRADGDTCTDDLECRDGSFCSGTAVRRCAALPLSSEACPEGRCAEGSWCDTSRIAGPVCRLEKGTGGDCAADAECASGYCGGTMCATLCAGPTP